MKAIVKPLCAIVFCVVLSMPSRAQVTGGTVIDAATHAPVPGALLTAASGVQRADRLGKFTVDPATRTIDARAPGYLRIHIAVESRKPLTVALTPFRPKAVYLSAYGILSPTLRDAALSLTRTTAINAFVIDVKDDRGIHTAALPAWPPGRTPMHRRPGR